MKKAENAESEPIYHRVLQAAKELERASESLSEMLMELQGG